MASYVEQYDSCTIDQLKAIFIETINKGENYLIDMHKEIGEEYYEKVKEENITKLEDIADYKYRKEDLINFILVSDKINEMILKTNYNLNVINSISDTLEVIDKAHKEELLVEFHNAVNNFNTAGEATTQMIALICDCISKTIDNELREEALVAAQNIAKVILMQKEQKEEQKETLCT